MLGAAKSGIWLGAVTAVALSAGVCAPAFALDLIGAPVVRIPDPPSAESKAARLREALDKAFGSGRWKITSGFRSEAQENHLRAIGAGTVRRGAISKHSMGAPGSPGAFDVVVEGMAQSQAAALLRASAPDFSRILYEGAHGPEGPHLHIEMDGNGALRLGDGSPLPHAPPGAKTVSLAEIHMNACNSVYERVVGGHRNPKLKGC
jgi:hypothetical protein